jgi:hypothetical protein
MDRTANQSASQGGTGRAGFRSFFFFFSFFSLLILWVRFLVEEADWVMDGGRAWKLVG